MGKSAFLAICYDQIFQVHLCIFIKLLKIFRLFTDSRITSEKLVLTEGSIYENQKRE